MRLLAADPARSVLLSDFDGTLAPIVLDPDSAAPLPGAVELLHLLAGELEAVAVVSGRPAEFLAERLALRTGSPLRAFGLYGLEEALPGGGWQPGPGVAGFDHDRWRGAVERAAAELGAALPAGALLEPKGLSIALHWRTAPAAEGAVEALARSVAASSGLALHRGRMALELSPPQSGEKGDVVRSLCAGAAAACFLGDDLGDVSAFDALAALAAESGLRPLRIAVASAESPPELLARADEVVEGPAAVRALLEELAGELAARREGGRRG